MINRRMLHNNYESISNKQMNKITLAVLTLLTVGGHSLYARQISPEQALQRAGFPSTSTYNKSLVNKPELSMEIKGSRNPSLTAVYVFETNPGYLILSADDVAVPVLGYSDTGKIGNNDMPSGLAYWLNSYANEIDWAVTNNIPTSQATTSPAINMNPITPLIKTQWNQSAPYNNDCPQFNGETSVTGCVATAMAQAMYYYQWPITAQGGTLTYTSESEYSSSQTKEISYNFDDVTFDWSDMLTNYGSSSADYTQAQGTAVAELMYACGVSVQMDYSPEESGAPSVAIAPALYKYFNYSSELTMPQRAYYTTEQWENLVYNELAAGRPVLYGGQSIDGGHQFICDGYSGDGYFHFNWGWSGQSDGYYLLSALNPESQGTGGSTSGYNFDQDIVINMKKPSASDVAKYLICCNGDFIMASMSSSNSGEYVTRTVELGQSVEFISSDIFLNYSCREVTGRFGILITDESGNTVEAYSTSNVTMPMVSEEEGIQYYTAAIPSSLTNGTYTVTPIFKPENASDYTNILCPLSGVQSLSMTVSGNSAEISVGKAPEVSLTSAEFKSEVYDGSYFSLDFTLDNQGTTEYYGLIAAVLVQDGEEVASTSQQVTVTLSAGEQNTFNLIGLFESENGESIEAGNYTVYLIDTTTDNTLQSSTGSGISVTVNSALESDAQLTVTLTLEGSANDVDPTNAMFTGTVRCESGYYANQLEFALFNYNPNGGSEESLMTSATEYMFLSEGQETSFTLNLDLSSVTTSGNMYMAGMFTSEGTQLTSTSPFTIATTGIEAINADENDLHIYPIPANDYITVSSGHSIEKIKLYNLSGQTVVNLDADNHSTQTINVESLPTGHYLISVQFDNGTTTTRHIIIN